MNSKERWIEIIEEEVTRRKVWMEASNLSERERKQWLRYFDEMNAIPNQPAFPEKIDWPCRPDGGGYKQVEGIPIAEVA